MSLQKLLNGKNFSKRVALMMLKYSTSSVDRSIKPNRFEITQKIKNNEVNVTTALSLYRELPEPDPYVMSALIKLLYAQDCTAEGLFLVQDVLNNNITSVYVLKTLLIMSIKNKRPDLVELLFKRMANLKLVRSQLLN
jgi:hypothetical protein